MPDKNPSKPTKKRTTKADKELLLKVRKRYKTMYQADEDNRRDAMHDMRFVNVPGAQWDRNMKQERGNRPCYQFNKVRVNGKRVINEIRANRPSGKVRGVEGGDKETAEIFDGLLRNIANVSDFETIQDYAAEYQVNAGMAAWQVTTEYRSDSVFDQDIFIETIKNPFCLFADPAAQDVLKRDAYDWILTEKMPKRDYEAKYPNADPVDFEIEDDFDDNEDDWTEDEFVRIASYWWKEPVKKTIVQLEDGKVLDTESKGYQALVSSGEELKVVKTREIDSHDIMQAIVSGNAVLEQPKKQAGQEHRFVMIYGEYIVIDGKSYWWGLPRFAKDAQRSYNISRTAIAETIAMAPQAKVWLTAAQGKGLENQIAEAHRKNFPVMYYNEDPKAPGPPKRVGGADIPAALMMETELASKEIDDTQGIFAASRGEESNETSGIALARKQRQGALVTFNYPDNMAKGVQRTFEIIIDLIPIVLDTERELRVLGADGAEDYVKVNEVVHDAKTGKNVTLNDLARGTFDVTVTTGPSFSTLREEAVESYTLLAQSDPLLMPTAGDLVYKSMDLPFSDEIAERRRAMLPPEIQKLLSQEGDVSPAAQAALAEAEQAKLIVQEQTRLVTEAAAEVQEDQNAANETKAEVEKLISDLEVKRAQFEAKVAKELANIEVKNAQAATNAANQGVNNDREALGADLREAIGSITEMAVEFRQQAVNTLAEIQARTEPTVVVPPSPRIKEIRQRQENGVKIIEPVYEDEPESQASKLN